MLGGSLLIGMDEAKGGLADEGVCSWAVKTGSMYMNCQ